MPLRKRTLFAILLVVFLAACMRNPDPQPVKQFQMRGEVTSLDSANQLATVKHEKIEGWMEAMTMEYPVKDKAEFAKLKVGETIRAQIDVQGTDYWIAQVTADAGK